jgi:hypothetical protein
MNCRLDKLDGKIKAILSILEEEELKLVKYKDLKTYRGSSLMRKGQKVI